ncbi:MAG: methyl-accepting chemotaxis protein [Hydrogenophaga sp.]|jgi:methyl-accepting chemotaxis protein
MSWFDHVSVRHKLLLLCALFATGLLTLALITVWALRDSSQQVQQLVQTELAASSLLGDVRGNLGNMRRYEKDLFLNLADEQELQRHHSAWQAAVAVTVTKLGELNALVGSAAQVEIQKMADGIERYQTAVNAIHTSISRGEINDPWAANKQMVPAKASVRAADEGLAGLTDAITQAASDRMAAQASVQSRLLLVTVLVASTVLALALGAGWLMAHRISGPIESAARAMERMAEGDLGVLVNVQGGGETGRMLASLAKMQQALSRMVQEIRLNVASVETASSEIAQGNQDLSARTEQAASNLEETAASMEQLTSTVLQSADSARQANQLAASACEIAVRGGNVVGQVVTTMNEISASSKKISDIIGVIDGIASQTNILALNAAVEAARAGEQGRGFAVVAAEVRSLAQRSAEAAKEIKGLIGYSVDRVDAGSRLVTQAGQTMSKIVGSVQRVSDIIGEITAAAGEQSDGISQVNVAVNQLDQMTQQNAALVEQSAAAAESLKDQAARLKEAVAMFQTAA